MSTDPETTEEKQSYEAPSPAMSDYVLRACRFLLAFLLGVVAAELWIATRDLRLLQLMKTEWPR